VVAAHVSFARYTVLSRHGYTGAGTVIGEAVVPADQDLADHRAQRQRIAAMRALVGERDDLTRRTAKQCNVLAEDLARERTLLKFEAERRNVPSSRKYMVPHLSRLFWQSLSDKTLITRA